MLCGVCGENINTKRDTIDQKMITLGKQKNTVSSKTTVENSNASVDSLKYSLIPFLKELNNLSLILYQKIADKFD